MGEKGGGQGRGGGGMGRRVSGGKLRPVKNNKTESRCAGGLVSSWGEAAIRLRGAR